MTKETKWLSLILIITVVLLLGGVFLLSRQSSRAVAGIAVSQIDYTKGQKIGSDSAKVRLVEFSDFECSACAVAQPYLVKLKVAYPDQMQFIYRHFPLPPHKYSRSAATVAEAAGEQGKFWEMHDGLLETQTEWSKLSDSDVTPFFLRLAKELNLDENRIKKALEENAFEIVLDNDFAEGERLGVDSTPTFFLNGQKLNLKTFDDLNTAVTEEMKK